MQRKKILEEKPEPRRSSKAHAVAAVRTIKGEQTLIVWVYGDSKNLNWIIGTTKNDYGVYKVSEKKWHQFKVSMCGERTLAVEMAKKDLETLKAFWGEEEQKRYRSNRWEGWIEIARERQLQKRQEMMWQRRRQELKERNESLYEIPKEAMKWLHEVAEVRHTLAYKRRGRTATVQCSSCGGKAEYLFETVTLEDMARARGEKPLHNAPGFCTLCGAPGVYKAAGRYKHYYKKQEQACILQKTKDPNRVVARYMVITVGQDASHEQITSIGMHAFNGCSSLEEISLPDSLTEIDALAFRATGLKKIDFPDGVVKIDCLAFAVCESLSYVNMPKNLQQIGTWAFATCPKLTSITIPKGTTTVLNYYNGLLVNTTESPFKNSDALQDVTLENGMKKVANSLFDDMTSIKKIIIPDTVTTIGAYCFYKAANLEDVTLSKNLYKLGDKAFSACTSLEKIVLPDTVGSMGESVFAGCTLLSDVTLPKYRLNITRYTFENCTSLKGITLPEDVQYIREGAFKGCERLESITTPKNFIGICYEAFRDCKRLETAKITGKEIAKSAFEGCQELTKVELSDTVTTIGSNAFKNCSSLSSIKLSNGMTRIYEGTFDGCSVLNDVVVPYTVTEIQKNAFANCVSLSNITIPKRVEGIADTVFSYPDKVTIYGVTGSYAEEYADKQEIKFESNDVSAQSIQLSGSSYSLYNSLGTMQIPHTFTPANMASDVIWKSSDEEVATVDEDGCVIPHNPGTCTIEVIAGSAQAKCSITVLPSVRELSITGNSNMKAGDKSQLSYALQDGSISAAEVRWISHDASVVSVDDTGLITAHTNGEVTIDAYWIRDTDDVRDEVTIKVTDNASGTTTPAPTTSTKPMPTTSAKPGPTASVRPTSNPSSFAPSDKTNRPGTNGSNNANVSGYKNKSVKAPAKVTGLKVKNIKKNKMKISWKWKVVDGYQIQYALNRKFTKQKKTVTVGKGTSTKTIKRLKKNKVYYVRVRAFNKSGGTKKYGKWSAVKKIKIKK